MAGTGGIAGVDDVDPFDSAGNVMGMDADAMDAPMGGESAAAQVQQQDKRFLELRIRRAAQFICGRCSREVPWLTSWEVVNL